jgi:hypothetical protein
MPFSSTQWFKLSTMQSKYNRLTNTSIQNTVAKLITCLPAGRNINPPGYETYSYGSCLKSTKFDFTFNIIISDMLCSLRQPPGYLHAGHKPGGLRQPKSLAVAGVKHPRQHL